MATIIDSGWYMPHFIVSSIGVVWDWLWFKYCDAWRYKGAPAPMTVYALDKGCKCKWVNERIDFDECPLHSEEENEKILWWLADDPGDKPVA